MQGYSGQPIFYPNPVPQVLVQQAYPNIPVSSVSICVRIMWSFEQSGGKLFCTFYNTPKNCIYQAE